MACATEQPGNGTSAYLHLQIAQATRAPSSIRDSSDFLLQPALYTHPFTHNCQWEPPRMRSSNLWRPTTRAHQAFQPVSSIVDRRTVCTTSGLSGKQGALKCHSLNAGTISNLFYPSSWFRLSARDDGELTLWVPAQWGRGVTAVVPVGRFQPEMLCRLRSRRIDPQSLLELLGDYQPQHMVSAGLYECPIDIGSNLDLRISQLTAERSLEMIAE